MSAAQPAAESSNSAMPPAKVTSAAMAKRQKAQPLDGHEHAVAVEYVEKEGYRVRFPFDTALVAEIQRVPDALFDDENTCWKVPVKQYDALAAALVKMRAEVIATEKSYAGVTELARIAAVARQESRNVSEVQPKISRWHVQGEPLRGEILSVNDRFAAQLTGFGSSDGAAFIRLHRLSELEKPLFKGDHAAITYKKSGLAAVDHMRTAAQRLDDSLGRHVDGIKVTQEGDRYMIEFDYSPSVSERISRVDGAAFDRDKKAWSVGVDVKEFVARAVSDMRKEVVADRADREQLETVAAEKIDNAKVAPAFVSDGKVYTGTVLAVNDRYVLQHTGKEYVALHRRKGLSETPEVSHNVRIAYKGGRGAVTDKSKDRSEGITR